jgi:hypothetical protein
MLILITLPPLRGPTPCLQAWFSNISVSSIQSPASQYLRKCCPHTTRIAPRCDRRSIGYSGASPRQVTLDWSRSAPGRGGGTIRKQSGSARATPTIAFAATCSISGCKLHERCLRLGFLIACCCCTCHVARTDYPDVSTSGRVERAKSRSHSEGPSIG